MTYRPSRLTVSIPTVSRDGKFYGIYPNGNAPVAAALRGNALDTMAAAGALASASAKLAGAAADTVSAAGTLLTGGFTGLVSINASNFVNGAAGSGAVVQLRGANFQGLDSSSAQGFQPWYGSTPDIATFKTWSPNAVRLPLNAASFLGLSCLQINAGGNGWVSTTPTSADPFNNYVAAVDAFIAAAHAVGLYVILDLHWSLPDLTFGGIKAHAMPLSQSPFMNSDTDLAFWHAIAARYGTQAVPRPGISNNAIIFELFNEPFIDQLPGYSQGGTVWGLMKNGGAVTVLSTNGRTTNVAQSWTALGYQQVLYDIRAIGAQNPVICNGCGYANASSGFASFLPSDTLTPAQVAVGQHTYPSGTYPYTNGNTYPQTFPDPNAGTVNWDVGAKAVLAAGIPLAITEDGGTYGPAATSGEPHITYMTGWADTNGASYINWQFWPEVPATQNGTNDSMTTSGTPTTGQGVAFYNWLTHNLPVTISTTSPLPPGNVGTAYSVTLAASGGTAPYTWAITGGSLPAGLGLSSSGIISGTPTTTVTNQATTVTATDSGGRTASLTFTITIAAASANLVMYSNGVIGPVWSGAGNQDLSYSLTTKNYTDTSSPNPPHTMDLQLAGQFGASLHTTAWSPEYQGGANGYDISSCTKVQLKMKNPTGMNYGMSAVTMRGDQYKGADLNCSCSIDSLTHVPGAAWTDNVYSTVTVDLAFLGLLSAYNHYKIGLQLQQAGPVYWDDFWFVPGNIGHVYRGNAHLESGWADASSGTTVDYTWLPQSLYPYTTTGAQGLEAVNNPPSPASSFFASISGTTLTVTSPSTKGPILPGQRLFFGNTSAAMPGNTVPNPVWVKILSGSGTSFVLDTNLGTVAAQQMMSVAMMPDVAMARVTFTTAAGKWRANYAGGYDLTPYSKFTFAANSPTSGNQWLVQFYNTAGVAIGTAINPNAAAYRTEDRGTSNSKCTVFVIPLSALGIAGQTIGGFSIQNTSGATTVAQFSGVAFYS